MNTRYSLYNYQSETVEKMKQAESNQVRKHHGMEVGSSFGINTNSFGAGKTRTTLKLIEEDGLTFDNCKTFYIRGGASSSMGLFKLSYEECQELRIVQLHSSIVFMDKKLIGEWRKEADKVGFSNFVFIDAPGCIGKERMDNLVPKLMDKSTAPLAILCTTQMMFEFMSALKMNLPNIGLTLWKRMVFDDLHATKKFTGIRGSCNFAALFTWFLNGTPVLMKANFENICTRHFGLSANYMFYAHEVNVPVPAVVYAPPALVPHSHIYKRNDIIDAMADVMPAEVYERLATGDNEGAYKALLGADDDQNIPLADRKPLHELVIEKQEHKLDNLKKDLERYAANGWNTGGVEARIVETERAIAGIRERVLKTLEDCECPICIDSCERNKMVFTKCCTNGFCRNCMGNLFKTKTKIPCPACRTEITMKNMYAFDENGVAKDIEKICRRENPVIAAAANAIPKTPMECLEKICMERPQGKILVFAPYQETSDAIQRYLKGSPVKFAELKGMAKTIAKRLKEFEEGKFNVLFLNSKTGNSGFNLQCATDVVIIGKKMEHIHEPAIKQITSRVARFPRTQEVPVHFIHN